MRRTASLVLACMLLCAAAAGGVFAADAATEPPVPDAELKAVVEKLRAKLDSGARAPAEFTDELKGFDAIVEAHRREPTEVAAQALYAKANVYLQLFEDYDTAATLLRQLTADFPKSALVENANGLIGMIDQHNKGVEIQASLKPGAVFPDFQEKELDGQPLSLARFKGKVVLVDFWATWCGPCVRELPNVLAAYRKYHDKGFEIVGISLDEDEGALQGFIAAKGMSWAQYFDGLKWDNKLSNRYGVTSIPATYLLDGDGKIVAKDLRGPALETELERLLTK